ncbi:MAG: cytosolic protein [Chloroflexi bacterium]|nr:cytosolic protein [Chloroflexota bacterium]
MTPLDLAEVCEYVNQNIVEFHQRRISTLSELRLPSLLSKNPYLFRAKNLATASELITSLLDALLSSSEEKLFGDFLEDLAIFIAGKTCNGHKSSAPGVDLEFISDGVHYVVSIKSGTRWGNSSQKRWLEQDLQEAVKRIKQSRHAANVQPVLGICYGKTKTSYLRGYQQVVGQNFWYLISGNKALYTDIIEPIGYRAREHNDFFAAEKAKVINRFTGLFIERFCDEFGAIDWVRLVEFNSGNFDLEGLHSPN